MKNLKYFFGIIPFVLLFACKSQQINKENAEQVKIPTQVEPNLPIIDKPQASQEVVINNVVEVENTRSQTTMLSDFSFDIFKNLSTAKQNENLSFSPVSLNIAMGMVYCGADGNTKAELSNVMGFNANDDLFFQSFSEYLKYLNSFAKDTSVNFNLANRIFLDKNYVIKDSYREIIKTYFDGGFENVDFRNNYRAEEKKINKWVSDMTHNRINDLLPDGTLQPLTRMVLVNAIYIKSSWKFPFDENMTQKKDFMPTPETVTKTDFMIQKTRGVRYAEKNGYQILELPYTTPELSIVIILPKDSNSSNISSLIPSFDEFSEMCKDLRYEEVYMEIPKFKTESSFELAKDLISMGILDAFGGADFSKLTESNDLRIDEVIQKVFFEIDEKGSEAAAATAVIMVETSSVFQPEFDSFMSFVANRPFIYILKENRYNTPLFIGLYVDPTK